MSNTDFDTKQLPGSTSLEAPHKVVVKVGGEVKGEVLQSEKLGVVMRTFAERAGIRSFAALIDGQKANSSMVNNSLQGVHEVEIIPKDARGSN